MNADGVLRAIKEGDEDCKGRTEDCKERDEGCRLSPRSAESESVRDRPKTGLATDDGRKHKQP